MKNYSFYFTLRITIWSIVWKKNRSLCEIDGDDFVSRDMVLVVVSVIKRK